AAALARRRLDAADAGDGAHRLLDRARDQLLDLEWADVGVVRVHRNRRRGELRHEIDREFGQRDDAEQHDDAAEHEHRDRPVDRDAVNSESSSLRLLSKEFREWPLQCRVVARRRHGRRLVVPLTLLSLALSLAIGWLPLASAIAAACPSTASVRDAAGKHD